MRLLRILGDLTWE
jgi:hypothetical protein